MYGFLDSQSCAVLCKTPHHGMCKSSQCREYMSWDDGQICQLMYGDRCPMGALVDETSCI